MTVEYFSSRRKKYVELSNFSPHNVVIDNKSFEFSHPITYATGEHAFHGEKFRRLGVNCQTPQRSQQLLNYASKFCDNIIDSLGELSKIDNSGELSKIDNLPKLAKIAGGKKGLLLTKEEQIQWEAISEEVQLEICKSKLELHPQVQLVLTSTGDSILIHSVFRTKPENLDKEIWGGKAIIVDGKNTIFGKNKLGNIWMSLR